MLGQLAVEVHFVLPFIAQETQSRSYDLGNLRFDDQIEVEIAEDVRVRQMRSMVAEVRELAIPRTRKSRTLRFLNRKQGASTSR